MKSGVNTYIHILYLYNINVPPPNSYFPLSLQQLPPPSVSQSGIRLVWDCFNSMSKGPTKEIPTDGCPSGLHCLHLRQQLPPEPVLLHLRRRLKPRRWGPAGSRPRGIGSTPPPGGGPGGSEKNRGPKNSAQNRGQKKSGFRHKGTGWTPQGGGTAAPIHPSTSIIDHKKKPGPRPPPPLRRRRVDAGPPSRPRRPMRNF